MVCDRRGRVVRANARLRDLLGAGAGASCCSLLGCGQASELADGCISARVLEAGEALPEARIDVPTLGRVCVRAALLYGDRSHVVIELRPEGTATARPSLQVFTLGPLRVEAADRDLHGPWLDQRAGQLLRYLTCERRRVAAA